MPSATSEQSLRCLVDAIITNNDKLFSELMAASAGLATASFSQGATRQAASPASNFIEEIGHCIYSGDTALHFAAAAYRHKMAEQLIKAGANVRAKNRRGSEPLHAAAFGNPDSPRWNPAAQIATISYLIGAGADPNTPNMDGATPLHRAVRSRCAAAVRALLDHGADPMQRNKNGSTPRDLAMHNTGRSGSGSSAAKAQQQEILRILEAY